MFPVCSNYNSYYILVECQTFKCVVNAISEKKLNVKEVPNKIKKKKNQTNKKTTINKESLLTSSASLPVLDQAGVVSQWIQALEFGSRSKCAYFPNQGHVRLVAALQAHC